MNKTLKKIIRPVLVIAGLREPIKRLQPEKPISKRPTPTQGEQRYIDEFRNDVKSLPPLEKVMETTDAERKWSDRQRKLRENMIMRDPRDFHSWEEIKYSMLGEYVPRELETIKKSAMWPLWKEALAEEEFCELNKSWETPHKNRATMIGNAYKLSQLILTHQVDLTKINTIFEFGGGYGSIARLCFRLGFKGTYIIFDLPEFSALQKYFLSASELPVKISMVPIKAEPNTVVLLSQASQLKEQLGNTPADMFTATWSLSESPLSLRETIVSLIKNVKYFLIAYQEKFPVYSGTDNIAYFKKLQEEIPATWETRPFKLHPKDYFLIGKK